MLAATLREAGYAVVEAIGPGQARDLLATRPFDLAVIDLIMPDENGVDVLQQLRGFEFGARLSAVVLNVLPTGSARESVVDCVKHLGNAEVLDKPVTPTTLLAALRRLVPRSG
jgi:DNA-binding response OmpR family regulator